MAKRVKVVSKRVPKIVDIGPKQPLVDPKAVATALGAEIVDRSDLPPWIRRTK